MRRKRTKSSRPAFRVTFSPRSGVHLEGTILWMDGFSAQGLAFLSHAHLRVPSQASQIVTTRQTAVLAGLEGPGLLISPFDRPFSVGNLDLELLSSGHIPGAASLLVRWNGTQVLYAGTVNPEPGLMPTEPCQTRHAEALVLGCRYGHPRFAFPKPDHAVERLLELVSHRLARGQTPVLLFNEPVGKAQGLAALFHSENLDTWAHRKICDGATKMRDLGLAVGHPRRLESAKASTAKGVVLWLLSSREAGTLNNLPKPYFILVSGLAADPMALAQTKASDGVVLSDHADFAGLLSYVDRVQARHVFLLPGRPHPFAATLKKKGLRVSILHPTQLALF